jgi:hypothetical protein
LGIGTATPTSRLDVIGTFDALPVRVLRQATYGEILRIGRNGVSETASINYPADGVFAINTAASERMRVNASGNVLINTTTDAGFRLDVNGSVRATGSISAASAIARGTFLNQTLVATANNDVLVGLEINPTFTNGAFTGVKNNWINLVGNASINFTNQLYLKRGDVDVLFASSAETQLKTVSSSAPLKFFVGSTSQYAQFFATTGNFILQNGGTFTDAGFRLDVNGTARFVSDIRSTTGVYIGTTATLAGVFPTGVGSREGLILRSSLIPSETGTDFYITNAQGNVANLSGTRALVNIDRGFNPTSGTGVYNIFQIAPTINQTGGASGISRGIYIVPTLTAAADFRAIEVTAGTTVLAPSVTARASLRIPSGTAPTSPVNGDIWFDGTNLQMRIGGVTKTFTLI